MLAWVCSQDGLEPEFKSDMDELLTSSPYTWHVMYGYRTIELQEKLYEIYLAGGPKAAPPGHSAHNFGMAEDLQLIVNGKAEWNTNHPGWQWLFEKVKAHPRLHSGVGFGDADHVEKYKWYNYENWNKA